MTGGITMNIKTAAIVWVWALMLFPMSIWGQEAFMTRVTYDNLAQIERFEFPDGSCVLYQYHNEMGIASRVTYQSGSQSQTFVSGIGLNESGLVTSVDLPNGKKTYDFDSLNQLREQRFDHGGATRYHAQSMTYNHLGGLKSLVRQDPSLDATIQYEPTEQGQLRTYRLGSQTATYRYDGQGNLTAVDGFSTADGLEIPPYSAGNNAYQDNNRNRNWDYDAQGRLLRDDRHRYYYNIMGRLAMVRDLATGIPLQTYLYDGAGNRVRTSDIRSGSVTYTIRDRSGAIVAEKVDCSSGPDQTTNFIYHNGEIIATWTREAGSQTIEKRQIFNDPQGSPAVVVGDTEITHYEYGPFGRQMSEPRNFGSHGYTGHADDQATNLTYMLARYYDAITGRFLTPDPARDFNPHLPASYNLYQYVHNDPINYIDPTGTTLAGAITGVATAVGVYRELEEMGHDFSRPPQIETRELTSAETVAVLVGVGVVGVVCDYCDAAMIAADIAINGPHWSHTLAALPLVPGVVIKVVRGGDDLVNAAKTGKKFWTNVTTFQRNKVLQRNDLIDPARIDPRTGMTSLDLMKAGRSPIGPDGKPINLHHMTQKHGGAVAEVTQTFHQRNNKVIHLNPSSMPSGINRSQFNKWRSDYWRSRANDF